MLEFTVNRITSLKTEISLKANHTLHRVLKLALRGNKSWVNTHTQSSLAEADDFWHKLNLHFAHFSRSTCGSRVLDPLFDIENVPLYSSTQINLTALSLDHSDPFNRFSIVAERELSFATVV